MPMIPMPNSTTPGVPDPTPTTTASAVMLAPYILQLAGLIIVGLYFLIHDNVEPTTFFTFIQILTGLNAVGGSIIGAVHVATRAGIQKKAVEVETKAGATPV